MQCRHHFATGAGLATAAFASDKPNATHLDQVPEPRLQLFAGGRCKKVVGLDLLAEGMTGEAEVLAVHQRPPLDLSPSKSRRRRPSGGASGAREGESDLVAWSRLTKQLA